jgi:hypothetical protein
MHAYVGEHPVDERLPGPDKKVCRLCGKHTDMSAFPPGAGGGGGPTVIG